MRKVLVINSAKGGVGKTKTAISIAQSLFKAGELVAILDLDITTPNIGTIKDIKTYTAPTSSDLSKAQIKKLIIATLNDFEDGWLIIDTPPTISKLYSAITESINFAQFLFVTTPSENAIADTSIGIKFFAQRKIIPIGIIQNMVNGPFGNEFDSEKRMGVKTLGTIPIIAKTDTTDYFKPIVKKLQALEFKYSSIKKDQTRIMSTLTVNEVEKDDYLPLKFYNLETWDIIRERILDQEDEIFHFAGGHIQKSHYNISTDKLKCESPNRHTSYDWKN